MKKIRNFTLALLAALLPLGMWGARDLDSYRTAYIGDYCDLAVSEMYRTGVPASITLAQGLLESGAGRSTLAKEHNNHFGIKCHNWNGEKAYHDDDAKGECFRKYLTPEQSFKDHSDFLRGNSRYHSLFDLKVTDYKGWAYGLKKAGYATDPTYAQKLINLIEEYELYAYDQPKKASKGKGKGKGNKETAVQEEEQVVPESPRKLQQAKPVNPGTREVFTFTLSRKMFSQNGVPFVYAKDGETYSGLAKDYHLFKNEILRFNDLKEDSPLDAGTVVYLQAKKSKAAKGLDTHVIQEGETLRDISQRYAVRMKCLLRYNHIKSGDELVPGDMIRLKK